MDRHLQCPHQLLQFRLQPGVSGGDHQDRVEQRRELLARRDSEKPDPVVLPIQGYRRWKSLDLILRLRRFPLSGRHRFEHQPVGQLRHPFQYRLLRATRRREPLLQKQQEPHRFNHIGQQLSYFHPSLFVPQ